MINASRSYYTPFLSALPFADDDLDVESKVDDGENGGGVPEIYDALDERQYTGLWCILLSFTAIYFLSPSRTLFRLSLQLFCFSIGAIPCRVLWC